jgi:NADPH-dependent curcumin reductase CurA
VTALEWRRAVQGVAEGVYSEFVSDYNDEFLEQVGGLVADGAIRYREQIVEGLEAAPCAFIGMLEGRNFGKVIVKVI